MEKRFINEVKKHNPNAQFVDFPTSFNQSYTTKYKDKVYIDNNHSNVEKIQSKTNIQCYVVPCTIDNKSFWAIFPTDEEVINSASKYWQLIDCTMKGNGSARSGFQTWAMEMETGLIIKNVEITHNGQSSSMIHIPFGKISDLKTKA